MSAITQSCCSGRACYNNNCPLDRRSKSFKELHGELEKAKNTCIASYCSYAYVLKAQRWLLKHDKEKFLESASRNEYKIYFGGITFR